MDFLGRIKKEMSEGIVRAMLEDAGYRVIDSGIEKVLRELSCLTTVEYKALGFPSAMSMLPDFTVMTRQQDRKFLVEVKYRQEWNRTVFEDVRSQVKCFGEMVLVSVNAGAKDPNGYGTPPSRFIRCCGLRWHQDAYEVELRSEARVTEWSAVDTVEDDPNLWWKMSPLSEKFSLLNDAKNSSTLSAAVKAMSGILA